MYLPSRCSSTCWVENSVSFRSAILEDTGLWKEMLSLAVYNYYTKMLTKFIFELMVFPQESVLVHKYNLAFRNANKGKIFQTQNKTCSFHILDTEQGSHKGWSYLPEEISVLLKKYSIVKLCLVPPDSSSIFQFSQRKHCSSLFNYLWGKRKE